MKTDKPLGLFDAITALSGLVGLVLIACAGSAPGLAAAGQSPLAPCPGKPNCVCSDDPDPGHRVPPFRLAAAPDEAWKSLEKIIAELPRTKVVSATNTDLQAEVKSRLFGFVDDLAFQLRPGQKIIAVRSASRSGYFDFGVNRKRVEDIREQLRVMGVVE